MDQYALSQILAVNLQEGIKRKLLEGHICLAGETQEPEGQEPFRDDLFRLPAARRVHLHHFRQMDFHPALQGKSFYNLPTTCDV